MSKSNVSSIRYSDEIKNIIEKQDGSSFSEKFHNLVFYCFENIPDLKKQEKELEHSIEVKNTQLRN